MINTILSIIGIIIVWQILSFIIYEITHENDDILVKFSLCFVVLIASIIGNIYQVYRLWYTHHYLDGYMWCYPNGTSIHSATYMTKKQADKFCQNESAPYHIKKVCEGKDFKSAPYKNDVYKGEAGPWKGHPIEKFLKKY